MQVGGRFAAVPATGLRKKQLLQRREGAREGSIELIIGLFCTWYLDQKDWRSLLRKQVGSGSVTGIDVPPPSANKLIFQTTMEKRVDMSLDEVNPLIWQGGNADELQALVEEIGFSPMQAIVVATRNGAEVCRMADRVGTMETGKLADLILVEGDPLNDIRILKEKERLTVFKQGMMVDGESLRQRHRS